MLACPFGAMTVVASASGAQAIKCDLCWHRGSGAGVRGSLPDQCVTVALTQHTCSASASILNLSERRSGLHDGRNNRQPSRQARSISSARIFYARLDFVRFRHVVHPHTLVCVCGQGLSSPGKK
ncbi:electron transporter [Salmonella enterica subsp. enterica]|uniref:Electron transporter n=1 Tax=Salmonella enterica I TaxID=59201 RepID=A0A447TSR7_SALET|nr:electron transporter [Salmonella enterica subsp. enterica]